MIEIDQPFLISKDYCKRNYYVIFILLRIGNLLYWIKIQPYLSYKITLYSLFLSSKPRPFVIGCYLTQADSFCPKIIPNTFITFSAGVIFTQIMYFLQNFISLEIFF